MTTPELRVADQSGLLELDRIPVGQSQSFQSRPLLTRDVDILPFFLADVASNWCLNTFIALHPSCYAGEKGHGCLSGRGEWFE